MNSLSTPGDSGPRADFLTLRGNTVSLERLVDRRKGDMWLLVEGFPGTVAYDRHFQFNGRVEVKLTSLSQRSPSHSQRPDKSEHSKTKTRSIAHPLPSRQRGLKD